MASFCSEPVAWVDPYVMEKVAARERQLSHSHHGRRSLGPNHGGNHSDSDDSGGDHTAAWGGLLDPSDEEQRPLIEKLKKMHDARVKRAAQQKTATIDAMVPPIDTQSTPISHMAASNGVVVAVTPKSGMIHFFDQDGVIPMHSLRLYGAQGLKDTGIPRAMTLGGGGFAGAAGALLGDVMGGIGDALRLGGRVGGDGAAIPGAGAAKPIDPADAVTKLLLDPLGRHCAVLFASGVSILYHIVTTVPDTEEGAHSEENKKGTKDKKKKSADGANGGSSTDDKPVRSPFQLLSIADPDAFVLESIGWNTANVSEATTDTVLFGSRSGAQLCTGRIGVLGVSEAKRLFQLPPMYRRAGPISSIVQFSDTHPSRTRSSVVLVAQGPRLFYFSSGAVWSAGSAGGGSASGGLGDGGSGHFELQALFQPFVGRPVLHNCLSVAGVTSAGTHHALYATVASPGGAKVTSSLKTPTGGRAPPTDLPTGAVPSESLVELVYPYAIQSVRRRQDTLNNLPRSSPYVADRSGDRSADAHAVASLGGGGDGIASFGSSQDHLSAAEAAPPLAFAWSYAGWLVSGTVNLGVGTTTTGYDLQSSDAAGRVLEGGRQPTDGSLQGLISSLNTHTLNQAVASGGAVGGEGSATREDGSQRRGQGSAPNAGLSQAPPRCVLSVANTLDMPLLLGLLDSHFNTKVNKDDAAASFTASTFLGGGGGGGGGGLSVGISAFSGAAVSGFGGSGTNSSFLVGGAPVAILPRPYSPLSAFYMLDRIVTIRCTYFHTIVTTTRRRYTFALPPWLTWYRGHLVQRVVKSAVPALVAHSTNTIHTLHVAPSSIPRGFASAHAFLAHNPKNIAVAITNVVAASEAETQRRQLFADRVGGAMGGGGGGGLSGVPAAGSRSAGPNGLSITFSSTSGHSGANASANAATVSLVHCFEGQLAWPPSAAVLSALNAADSIRGAMSSNATVTSSQVGTNTSSGPEGGPSSFLSSALGLGISSTLRNEATISGGTAGASLTQPELEKRQRALIRAAIADLEGRLVTSSCVLTKQALLQAALAANPLLLASTINSGPASSSASSSSQSAQVPQRLTPQQQQDLIARQTPVQRSLGIHQLLLQTPSNTFAPSSSGSSSTSVAGGQHHHQNTVIAALARQSPVSSALFGSVVAPEPADLYRVIALRYGGRALEEVTLPLHRREFSEMMTQGALVAHRIDSNNNRRSNDHCSSALAPKRLFCMALSLLSTPVAVARQEPLRMSHFRTQLLLEDYGEHFAKSRGVAFTLLEERALNARDESAHYAGSDQNGGGGGGSGGASGGGGRFGTNAMSTAGLHEAIKNDVALRRLRLCAKAATAALQTNEAYHSLLFQYAKQLAAAGELLRAGRYFALATNADTPYHLTNAAAYSADRKGRTPWAGIQAATHSYGSAILTLCDRTIQEEGSSRQSALVVSLSEKADILRQSRPEGTLRLYADDDDEYDDEYDEDEGEGDEEDKTKDTGDQNDVKGSQNNNSIAVPEQMGGQTPSRSPQREAAAATTEKAPAASAALNVLDTWVLQLLLGRAAEAEHISDIAQSNSRSTASSSVSSSLFASPSAPPSEKRLSHYYALARPADALHRHVSHVSQSLHWPSVGRTLRDFSTVSDAVVMIATAMKRYPLLLEYLTTHDRHLEAVGALLEHCSRSRRWRESCWIRFAPELIQRFPVKIIRDGWMRHFREIGVEPLRLIPTLLQYRPSFNDPMRVVDGNLVQLIAQARVERQQKALRAAMLRRRQQEKARTPLTFRLFGHRYLGEDGHLGTEDPALVGRVASAASGRSGSLIPVTPTRSREHMRTLSQNLVSPTTTAAMYQPPHALSRTPSYGALPTAYSADERLRLEQPYPSNMAVAYLTFVVQGAFSEASEGAYGGGGGYSSRGALGEYSGGGGGTVGGRRKGSAAVENLLLALLAAPNGGGSDADLLSLLECSQTLDPCYAYRTLIRTGRTTCAIHVLFRLGFLTQAVEQALLQNDVSLAKELVKSVRKGMRGVHARDSGYSVRRDLWLMIIRHVASKVDGARAALGIIAESKGDINVSHVLPHLSDNVLLADFKGLLQQSVADFGNLLGSVQRSIGGVAREGDTLREELRREGIQSHRVSQRLRCSGCGQPALSRQASVVFRSCGHAFHLNCFHQGTANVARAIEAMQTTQAGYVAALLRPPGDGTIQETTLLGARDHEEKGFGDADGHPPPSSLSRRRSTATGAAGIGAGGGVGASSAGFGHKQSVFGAAGGGSQHIYSEVSGYSTGGAAGHWLAASAEEEEGCGEQQQQQCFLCNPRATKAFLQAPLSIQVAKTGATAATASTVDENALLVDVDLSV